MKNELGISDEVKFRDSNSTGEITNIKSTGFCRYYVNWNTHDMTDGWYSKEELILLKKSL